MSRAKAVPPIPTFAECLAKLRAAGFAVDSQDAHRARVSKYGCAAVLEDTAKAPRFAGRPGLVIGEKILALVDRGFQKFWQDGEQRRPALATDLKALHSFEQELRATLGLTSLYNESLGTVSTHYLYDRVEGREQGPRHGSF